MRLLLFVLASYGVTNALAAGRIFGGLRSRLAANAPVLGHWIRCPMCLGVPVGILWALAGLGPGTCLGRGLDLVAAAAISSGACWLLSLLARVMGADDL